MADDKASIIIVKKKKGGDHGHHGGAWKVAYADFVTAMMAFFLLLWLLNVTSEVQKLGISEYFAAQSVSQTTSGSGGVLGGQTLSPGSLPRAATAVAIPLNRPPSEGEEETTHPEDPKQKEAEADDKLDYDKKADGGKKFDHDKKVGDKELEQLVAKREEERFKDAEFALRQAIQDVPELRQLAENLMIDQTPEGLRIQIVDQAKYSMFPNGSAAPYEHTRKLIALVAQVVTKLPNKVSVTGHTDSTQFAARSNYSNWELSTDRANSSRRALQEAGLAGGRITRVVGKAEHEPLDVKNPADPRNRRISIVLLRESQARAAR